jgi:hypothetical protein
MCNALDGALTAGLRIAGRDVSDLSVYQAYTHAICVTALCNFSPLPALLVQELVTSPSASG